MRKKSKYRPKPVNNMAHVVGLQGCLKLTTSDVLRCALLTNDAVDAITQARATKMDWQNLFGTVNLMEEMVKMRIASDPEGMIESMQEAVVAILDRQKQTGSKALKADEVKVLREIAATYAELLSGVTHAELYKAHERSTARVKRVLAGAESKGAKLVEAPE